MYLNDRSQLGRKTGNKNITIHFDSIFIGIKWLANYISILLPDLQSSLRDSQVTDEMKRPYFFILPVMCREGCEQTVKGTKVN